MADENLFADFIIEEEPKTEDPQADLFDPSDLPPLPSGTPENKKKNSKNDEKKSSRSQFLDPTHKALAEEASLSGLKKVIHDQKIKNIRLEREKIGLLKDAGKVGEIEFFEFCFLDYMEKMNIDTFKMFDRIESRIKMLVSQGKDKVIMETLRKEFSNVIRGVKIAQGNEVKRWNQS